MNFLQSKLLLTTVTDSLARLSVSSPGSGCSNSLTNYQPVRHLRPWRNVRPIMGWPRPHLARKNKKYPEPHIYNWRPYLPDDGSYTTKPLPIFKMGGRDMETGRVVVRTLGGGNPKKFRWVDTFKRALEDGSPREERVLMLKYDPLRTPRLALVADEEKMRWVFATHGIQVGDIIRTYSELPKNPVRAKEGDSHPIGALAVGTKIHQFEVQPGQGAKFCLSAGTYAEITSRTKEGIAVKLSHGDTFKVEPTCMATVGQMSNIDHQHVQMWCPQRLRWLGKRPRSGQWRRKDGYCGRKIYPPKLIDVTIESLKSKVAKQERPDVFDLSI